MASSIVSESSGDNNSQHHRGYAVRPVDTEKPIGAMDMDKPRGKPVAMMANYDLDEETKISYSCQNASLFLKLSSALLAVSCVIQIIAVGAPYWSAGWRRDKMAWHEGIWMTCVRHEEDNKWICSSYDYQNSKPGIPGWYAFTQAMGLISIVVFLPALLVNLFFTMHPKEKMFKGLRWFNLILTLITGLLPFMMVLTWGIGHPKDDRFPVNYNEKDYDDDPFEFHFSFVFEIFAFLISFAAFALEVIDFRRSNYE